MSILNAASVSLSVNDIFKTRINSQYSNSEYFIQDYSRLRDLQMVRLNLAYRFGNVDASLFQAYEQQRRTKCIREYSTIIEIV
ncbi:MAG: hypothetical protein ABI594_07760 [Ginsengibacter sp.]